MGCYTAESSIKKGNREAEAALVTAEKLSAVGSLAWGAEYPKDEFTAAWKRVLFLQFHDSLAGTSLPEHYETARDGQGRAIDVAQQAMYLSAQRLAWQVPAIDPESSYLFVFNPHAWNTIQNIEYDLGLSDKDSYAVEDDTGSADSIPMGAGDDRGAGKTQTCGAGEPAGVWLSADSHPKILGCGYGAHPS